MDEWLDILGRAVVRTPSLPREPALPNEPGPSQPVQAHLRRLRRRISTMTPWHTSAALIAILLVLPSAAGAGEVINPPAGDAITQVDFERHVQGLLGRMGCNA